MKEENFFLRGNAVIVDRIKAYPWSENPLGPFQNWPLSLKLYVSQIISHRFAQLILWGSDFIQIPNDAFLSIQGGLENPSDMLGCKSSEYFKATWHLVKDMVNLVYQEEKSFYNQDQGFPDSRTQGKSWAYYTYSYSPLMMEDGKVGGVLVTTIETTAGVESFRKLEISEHIARFALDAAEMGSFELDYKTGVVVCSDSHYQILGIHRELIQDYRPLYLPKDLKIRDKAHEEALKTGKLDFKARVNINGEIRWIHVLGKVVLDSQKNPIKLIGVIQDVTDKKAHEEQILLANKKLQHSIKEQKALQKQKDEFLQVASHELKTPLTAIKGFGQLVEQILEENGHIAESNMINKLNQRVDHLNTLLDNLFDVSKINSRKLDFRDSLLNLVDLLKFLVEDLRFTSIKHRIVEEYTFNAIVNADRHRVSQVVTNLLSNAIKYSPGNQEIKIRTRQVDRSIAVDIIDQGIGIESDEKEKIFDQFYRSKNLDNSQIRGLGLGLYLSQQIIDRKGGKIWAESELGKGSTFTFTLPIFEKR